MLRTIAVFLIAVVSAAVLAQAPANAPVRIRGTIGMIDGQDLTVKTNNGQTMNVKLADNCVVMGIARASVAEIDSGKFIGTTTLGDRDGALIALEVHIFPENILSRPPSVPRLSPVSRYLSLLSASLTAVSPRRASMSD